MKIGVYETNLSNKFSIFHALEFLNLETRIIEDVTDLSADEILILPGVGNFSKLINSLAEKDQMSLLREKAEHGQKILGICLGMQILFSRSEEGDTEGLNVLNGNVENLNKRKINHNIITPNIGWRETCFEDEYFEKYNNSYFYFVHQYEVKPIDKNVILSYSKIEDFSVVSAVAGKDSMENVYGIQFHPEKSGMKGIEFLDDLIKHIEKN
tara:strand:- start:20810 stop:21442 length:633 start_codon:yes stop_codon:yes gene_type:complete